MRLALPKLPEDKRIILPAVIILTTLAFTTVAGHGEIAMTAIVTGIVSYCMNCLT